MVKTTVDRFGRIDALLNIAGAVPQIDLFEMNDDQWYAGMELKLHGARRLTIRAWDALKAARIGGLYIWKCGARPQACLCGRGSYQMQRLLPLAKAFAEQGIKDGVQVYRCCPRACDDTSAPFLFMAKWAPAHKHERGRSHARSFPEEAGISRYGQPEEIADLVGLHGFLHLLSG